MEILTLAGVWFAFIVAFMLGAAFAISDVLSQKRYERERKAQKATQRHDERA